MHKRQWLKIIGVIELILAVTLALIFCIFLLSVMTRNDHRDGINYAIFTLTLLLPVALIFFAMGLTAYRNHESAVVMQILGGLLFIIIPLIILF